MNQTAFTNRVLIIVVALLAVMAGCTVVDKQPGHAPRSCTMEAKLCPDGSYVGRTGPNCEFAECPIPHPQPSPQPLPTPEPQPTPAPNPVSGNLDCTSDSDCPSAEYTCEGTEGYGTVYPNNSQPPTYTITKGECKLKAGGRCDSDGSCLSGLVCHERRCTEPRGEQCSGSTDMSCPSGYVCVQSCGPPVAREGDPPPPYYCELKEVAAKPRMCPICLAGTTRIDTPVGPISVRDMRAGMPIWTVDANGRRVEGVVVKVSTVPVPPSHHMAHLVLDDGRELFASPGHPTTDGRTVGDLSVSETYDGASVIRAEHVPYGESVTYDVLPSGETGYYWANGVLVGSTLK